MGPEGTLVFEEAAIGSNRDDRMIFEHRPLVGLFSLKNQVEWPSYPKRPSSAETCPLRVAGQHGRQVQRVGTSKHTIRSTSMERLDGTQDIICIKLRFDWHHGHYNLKALSC